VGLESKSDLMSEFEPASTLIVKMADLTLNNIMVSLSFIRINDFSPRLEGQIGELSGELVLRVDRF